MISTKATKQRSSVAGCQSPALEVFAPPHHRVQTKLADDRRLRTIFVCAVGLGTIASSFGFPGLFVGGLLGAVLGHVIQRQR